MSYESKSLFQSNINLLNHSKDRHVFPHSQAYVRIFYMLKGIRSRIKDTFDSLSEIIATTKFDNINERKLFMSLIKEVNSLLTCTFGTLYPISNEVVQNIHQLLLDETLNSKNAISIKFSKEAMKALKAVLVITRIFTLIQVGKEFTSIKSPDTEAPFKSTTNSCKNVERSEYSGFSRLKAFNSSVHNKARKQLPFSSDNEDDDYMTIVCRICDKRVRADLIEQHTFSCMNAYRSETKVQSINNIILEIQKNFIKDYLSEEWPGPRQKSVSETIPLLHASILLNRAFEIDPFNVDSADELSVISETLQIFTNYNLPNEIICEIVQLKRKVIEKRCACNAIAHASEIMKQTRVDNTGEPDFAIKTTISDFQFIKRISSGAFARVYLAKKKATGDIYAIKVQPKDDVIQKNQVKRVMAEKNILLKFNNPYIINFFYSFVGINNLYIVMEYLPGGDLFSLLQNVASLDEESAKTYTIQIANALGYLHSHGIIHRDIKPDNILVASDGTLRLTDFGLSYLGVVDRRVNEMSTENATNNFKGNKPPNIQIPENDSNSNQNKPMSPISRSSPKAAAKMIPSPKLNPNTKVRLENAQQAQSQNKENLVEAKSLVGTPDYIAPEIVLSLPHSFSVDWWSLGVMLYEFITGIPPFHGDTLEDTRERILRGTYKSPASDEFSPECIDFIHQLLKQNPKERLGTKGGLEEVMNHPWLKGIDIKDREPPFVPELSNELDTAYFEDRCEPSERDDSDIFADIQQAAMKQQAEMKANFRTRRAGSFFSPSSLASGTFLVSSQSDIDENENDSDMSEFPSIAVEQLVNKNMVAANVISRARASSMVNHEKNRSNYLTGDQKGPHSPSRSFIAGSSDDSKPIEGGSDSGVIPNTPRRRRRPINANAFASTDDLIKKLLPIPNRPVSKK